MTSHELARKLLNAKDIPVVFNYHDEHNDTYIHCEVKHCEILTNPEEVLLFYTKGKETEGKSLIIED